MTAVLERNTFIEGFCEGLEPEPEYLVSEWMEKKFYIPPGLSPEPGFFRLDRTPFNREIVDCLSPQSPVQEVIVRKATQVGMTTVGLGWLCSIIDLNPGPAIMVVDNLDKAREYSKTKLNPILTANQGFGKIRISSSRDSENTDLFKAFPGGFLKLTGANSSSGITSLPAQYGLFDEINRWPWEIPGEGNPLKIAEERLTAFREISKCFKLSTPTDKESCRITQEFENSDQRHLHVPCPFCGHKQKLEWRNIKFQHDDQRILTSPARYLCASCGKLIDEHHKTFMLANGEWIPDKPGHPKRGYQVHGLLSLWKSWTMAAQEWLDAIKKKEKQKDTTDLQTFINNYLAEPWEERGETIEVNFEAERCHEYFPGWRADDAQRPEVPAEAAILTAGVDVQDDRLEVEVVGWGRGRESWSIDYRVILGDPRRNEIWEELDEYVEKIWIHASGARLTISKIAVDTGFLAPMVYQYVRQRQPRVAAVKGRGGPGYDLVSNPHKIEKYKVQLYHVGVDGAKDLIYGWLKYELPGPGYCHFPVREGIYNKRNYFDKLTAEEKVPGKTKDGKRIYTYKLPSGRRNEALDCRVYALAALAILNPVNMDKLVDRLLAQAARFAAGAAPPQRNTGRRIISPGVQI